MLSIYKEQLENPKVKVVNNVQQVVREVCATSMHTIGVDALCNGQKQYKMCKKLLSPRHHSNKNSSKPFTLSADHYFKSTSTFIVSNMTYL